MQLSMIAFTYFLFHQGWYFTTLLTLILLILQSFEFLKFISRTNTKIAHFLKLAESEDYAFAFNKKKIGNGFDQLHNSLNTLLEKLKSARIDKESQFILFNQMINNLETGILAIGEQKDVLLTNPALHSLLQIPEEKDWDRLSKRVPELMQSLDTMEDQERTIIELQNGELKAQQILVTKRKFKINQNNFLFYSFQNIHKELEKKEIESWHKLIRVLTHEIMNSVSPIISLSSTLSLLLQNKELKNGKYHIDVHAFEDIELSLSTIQNRSKGLMQFIDEYSKLTKIPKPKIQLFDAKKSFIELQKLLSTNLKENHTHIQIHLTKPGLKIKGDPALLDQVFLNLLLNAIDGCKEVEAPRIDIFIDQNMQSSFIRIEDNGTGIPKEIEPDIFLPFYTTKEKGSGIGLSLSKNIVVSHNGELHYVRKNKGSSFVIELPF